MINKYPELNIKDTSPLLINKTKKGLKKYWRAFIKITDNKSYLIREYWQEKKDGSKSKHQFSTPKLIEPKNVGKLNETSIEEQSKAELISIINHQIDKNYYPEGYEEKQNITVLPMLALEYQKHYKKLIGKEVAIQPKLDGIRCLYSLDKGMYTRRGKVIIEDIQNLFPIKLISPNHILDGELILPNLYTFQETISAIKRSNNNTSKLTYILYDIIDLDNSYINYKERFNLINLTTQLNTSLRINVININNFKVLKSVEEVKKYNKDFISKGYEGVIIRNVETPYLIGNRSNSLLKFKSTFTEEFLIVDCKKEIATLNNEIIEAIIFICANKNKDTFSVRPKATLKERENMYKNKENLIGKMYTVQYQELTDENIPRFPIGLCIRDYE